jgi:hypothetical protein
MRPALHFIGFRGDEYLSAVRVWGRPDFIHRVHDKRAFREIAPVDIVVFAGKERPDVVREVNAPDVVGFGYTGDT